MGREAGPESVARFDVGRNEQAQKRPIFRLAFFDVWLREPDLNRRPSGYEPDELPDCSIPRLCGRILQQTAGLSTVNLALSQMSSFLDNSLIALHIVEAANRL